MKKSFIASVLTVLLSLSIPAMAATQAELQQKANGHYRSGLKAVQQGQAQLAEKHFKACLKLMPKHAHAKHHLLSLKQNAPQMKKKLLSKKFDKIIIKGIELEDASLSDALEALNIHIEMATQKSASGNFLITDPQKKFEGKRVSLKLKSVPASVALRFILEQVGARARYDAYVTMITPR